MESEIEENGLGWTGFYIDNKLVREVRFVDERNLDWILKQNSNQSSDQRIQMVRDE